MRNISVSVDQQALDKSIYDTVCRLHNDGRHLIPTGGGDNGKKPIIPHWAEYQERQPTGAELHEWQQKYRPTVWANVCGAASGVIVIDTDNHERQKELEARNLKPHVLTPKGAHFYIRHPGYPVKPLVNIVPGIDIRGDGSYANVIGTRKDGGEYKVLVPPIKGALYTVADLPKYIQDPAYSNSPPGMEITKWLIVSFNSPPM